MEQQVPTQDRRGTAVAALATRWVRGVTRFARSVLLAWSLAAVAALLFTLTHLGLDADVTHMVSAELPVRKALRAYQQTFPQYQDVMVLVVEGAPLERVDEAVDRLAPRLAEQGAFFRSVYVPGAGAFFEKHAFLYLNSDELADLTDQLAEAQPMLSKLAADPSLRGLFQALATIIENVGNDQPIELAPVLERINATLEAALAGRYAPLSWRTLMEGEKTQASTYRRFILVQARPDYNALFPIAPALAGVRSLAKAVGIDGEHGLRLRITGGLPLEHEEMQAVTKGAGLAGVLALLLVTVTLFVGLRSVRLIVASLFTLVAGLLLTAAFAAGAVGHLNMISVAFAVLNIGLGIDFSIHFCLRYQEAGQEGASPAQALPIAGREVAPALIVCAVTTAAGFYAFLPTPYTGVAELGLIAGTGILISLLASLTLLPALLHLWKPVTNSRHSLSISLPSRLVELPVRHRKAVLLGALLAAAGAGLLLPATRFDYNPLNLRDPNAESVSTFKALRADGTYPLLTAVVLARDAKELRTITEDLRKLPVVDEVITLNSFVPDHQSEKLDAIEELNLILGPDLQAFAPARPRVPLAAQRAALEHLLLSLDKRLAAGGLPFADSAQALRKTLRAVRQRLDGMDQSTRVRWMAELDTALVGTLPRNLAQLAAALDAQPFAVQDLPVDLVKRWLSDEGTFRIEVVPREDITEPAALRRFVTALQSIAPDATDEPVQLLVVGDTIIASFQQAFALACIVITAFVLLGLRSLKGAALVMGSLLFGALITVAILVVLGIPFNFANVIALPLLLGMGVDNGIHLVRRLGRAEGTSAIAVMHSSTTRAMVFSALTTIASFGNLSFSPHPGMASLGLVLVIGVLTMLLSTLCLVPALVSPNRLQDRSVVG